MAKNQILRKLLANTAVAGVLATTVVLSPVDVSVLSTAIAQAQATITVFGDDIVEYRAEKEFTATVPGATSGTVQFYLDGIPQGSPVPLQSGTATVKVIPVSYGKHTITARYITREDNRDVHPFEDGKKTFETPLPNKSIVVGTDDDTYTEGEFVDQYTNGLPTKTSIGTANNPRIFAPGDTFTVKGVMTVGRARKIYETGLNPVGNSIYLRTMEHNSWQFQTVSIGQADGTTQYTQGGLTLAQWGQGTVPGVNSQYRGQHKTARFTSYNQSVGDTMKYAVELKAPSDPGLYFVQFASWKDNYTHVLQRLDNTFYRIEPYEIPERTLPKNRTSLSVSADQTAVTEGTSSTLTAQVSPDNAAGSVQFKNNGENIGQPAAVTGGTATLNYTLPLGENNITAEFIPTDAQAFSGATTPTATTVTVTSVKITPTVTYTGPKTHKFGTKMWMTASVTDDKGDPVTGGKVEFILDGTPLPYPQPVKNGVATYDKTFSKTGEDKEYTITLRYIPDTGSNYKEVVSVPDTFIVAKTVTTELTVKADKTEAAIDDEVTLTAAVTPNTAKGTVQFKNNGQNLGQPVTVTDGEARLTQTLPLGTNNITAEFTPDDPNLHNAATTKTSTTVKINPRLSIEAITTDMPFLAGLPGELTARISDSTVTGTVKFFDVTDGGEVPLGTAKAQQNGVPVSNGIASVTDVIFNVTGNRQVKAVFTAEDGTTAELTQKFVVAQAGTGTLPETGGAGIWSNTLAALAIIALGGAAALANRRRFA